MATAKNASASSAAKGAAPAKAAPAKASSSSKSTSSQTTGSTSSSGKSAAGKSNSSSAVPAGKAAAPAKAAAKSSTPAAPQPTKSVAKAGKTPAAAATKANPAAAPAPAGKPAGKPAAGKTPAPKSVAPQAVAAPAVASPPPLKPLERKPPRKPYSPPVVEQHAVKGVTKDGISYTKDFDAKFLTGMKALLLEERISLVGQAGRLEDEANAIIEEQEMGDVQFDDEGGEGDTMVVERSRDLVLSAQARHTVMEIDAAIERLAIGTYGYSLESGRPIPRERLEAIPWATMLVEEKVGGIGRR